MSDVNACPPARSRGGRHRKSSVRPPFLPHAASPAVSHQQRGLNASLFVGRIGALAVALGVGFGWSSAVAVANADPVADTPNATDGSGTSAPSRGKAPTSRPAARSGGTAAAEAPVGRRAPSTAPITSHRREGAAPAPGSAQRPDHGPVPAVSPAAAPQTQIMADWARRVPATAASPAQTMIHALDPPLRTVSTAVLASAGKHTSAVDNADVHAAAPAPTPPVMVASAGAVSALDASPEGVGPSGGSPTDTPLAWATLAAARGDFVRPRSRAVAGSGQLVGTNTAGAHASDPITAFFHSVAALFENHTPTMRPAQTAESAGGVVTGSLNATDPDSPTLTYTVTGKPAHGTVNVATDGSYTYTPDAESAHTGTTDAFQVTVSDAGSGPHLHGLPGLLNMLSFGLIGSPGHTSTATVAVTVAAVNAAPTLSLQRTVNADGTTTIAVTATDPNSDPVTTTAALGSGRGTLTAVTGGYLFTPDAAYAHSLTVGGASTPGSDTVTVTATDGRGGATAASTAVTIAPTNQRPTITITNISTPAADGAVTITYTVADPDNTAGTTSDTITVTPNGTTDTKSLSLNGDNTLTYLPTDNARRSAASSPRTDQITLTITDGHGGTATATATVTVAPTAPAIPTVEITATDGATGVTTGTITPPGGTTPTYTITRQSGYGTASVDPVTGRWTFTPNTIGLVSAWAGNTTPTTSFTITATTGGQPSTPLQVVVPLTVPEDALIGIIQRFGSAPSAIAAGPNAYLYITDYGANSLTVFDPATKAKTIVPVGLGPQAVSVGSDGRVWVANTAGNTVTVLNSTGSVLRQAIGVGSAPSGIAFDSAGNAYVTNAGDNTVSVINLAYGVPQTLAVGDTPIGIATGPDGRLWTANYGDGTLSIIDPANTDTVTTIAAGTGHPWGIAVDPSGAVFVTDPIAGTLTILTPEVAVLVAAAASISRSAADSPVPAGYSREVTTIGGVPTALTLDHGTAYIADSAGNSVTALDADTGTTSILATGGNPIGVVTLGGTVYAASAGETTLTAMNSETGISTTTPIGVDTVTVTRADNGDLILANNYEHTISVITKSATPGPRYVATAWPGTFAGYFLPSAAAVGPDGTVYLGRGSWSDGHAVYVYDPSGDPASAQRAASFPGPFNSSPQKLVVDASGRIFCLNAFGLWVNEGSNPNTNQQVVTSFSISYNNALQPGAVIADFAAGPNGKIYAIAPVYESRLDDGNFGPAVYNQLLTIDPTNDYSVSVTPLTIPAAHIAVASDGQVYVSSALQGYDSSGEPIGGAVEIVDPTTDFHTTVDLRNPSVIAAGTDGNVYVAMSQTTTAEKAAIVAIHADHTISAPIATGFDTIESLVVGPDGNVYLSSFATPSIGVLNPATHALSTVQANGYAPYIPGTPFRVDGSQWLTAGSSGVFTSIGSAGSYNYWNLVNRITPYVPPAPPSAVPEDVSNLPTADPESPTVWSQAPNNVHDLFARLYAVTDHQGNRGIHVDQIVTASGDVRYVAYIGGTGFSEKQTLERNSLVAFPTYVDDEFVQTIRDATSAHPDAPIMLVGFSQGGLDAQNIAAASQSLGLNVTDLIAFSTPINQSPGNWYHSMFFIAKGDPVPLSFTNAFGHDLQDALGNIYEKWVGPSAFAHGDHEPYLTLSKQFDDESADLSPQVSAIKQDLTDFVGQIVVLKDGYARIDDGTPGGLVVPTF